MNWLQELGLLTLNLGIYFICRYLWNSAHETPQKARVWTFLIFGSCVSLLGAVAIFFDLSIYLYKVLTR